MLRLATLAIFTTCYLSAALATPNLHFSSSAMADEAPFRLTYSSLDLDYGKDVDRLVGELGKNQLKAQTVESLSKYHSKTHSFSILNSTYDRLKQILAINSQDNFYQSCVIVSKNVNSFTESIAARMNISIDRYCRYLFLKKLTSR